MDQPGKVANPARGQLNRDGVDGQERNSGRCPSLPVSCWRGLVN